MLVAGTAATLAAGAWLASPANHQVARPPGVAMEDVRIPSGSGATLAGWLLTGRTGRGGVLLLHGIRGDRRALVPRAKWLHALGYTVLLVDLQGHGESQGDHITFGHLESQDVVAAAGVLMKRTPDAPLGAIAISMGGAALLLAERPLPFQAVVLESVYPDIDTAVRQRLVARLGAPGGWLTPLLLWQLRPRLGIAPAALRPIDHLADVGAAVLLASGTRDPHPSLRDADAMFARLTEPKVRWNVEGAEHEDLFEHSPEHYRRRVSKFLGDYLGASPPVDVGGSR